MFENLTINSGSSITDWLSASYLHDVLFVEVSFYSIFVIHFFLTYFFKLHKFKKNKNTNVV